MKIWNSEAKEKREKLLEKRKKISLSRARQYDLERKKRSGDMINTTTSYFNVDPYKRYTKAPLVQNLKTLNYLAGQVYKQIKALNLSDEGRSEFLRNYDIKIQALVRTRFRQEEFK